MRFADRLALAAKAVVGLFNDRSSEAAFRLFPGISPGAVGFAPTRGVRQTLEAYSKMPWLRGVASRVGDGFASVDWELYRTGAPSPNPRTARDVQIQRAGLPQRKALLKQTQAAGELREVTDHIFLDLMRRPNPFMTGQMFRKLTMIHIDGVGEGFWIKERNGVQAPSALYPIPPNWITATPTPEHRFYRVGFRAWQGEIPDTEILWLKDPDPANPYGRGSGLAMALGDELDTDEYAAKAIKQSFLNMNLPDALIFPKSPGTLTPGNTERLEQDWNNRNQGFWRQFKAHFLGQELGVYEFKKTPLREMQMTELRKDERDRIINIWGIPPEIFGILESSNRSTIDSAFYLFAMLVLVPRLEFFRANLQEFLIPEWDDRLILDYVSPVPEDREFALKTAGQAPWTLLVDEWREMQGKPPIENGGGKVFMVPFQLQPVEQLIETRPAWMSPDVPITEGRSGNGGQRQSKIADAKWRHLTYEDAAIFRHAGDLASETVILRDMATNPEELPALSRVASRLEPALRRRFLEAIAAANGEVSLEELASALASGNMSQVEAAAKLDLLSNRLDGLLPDLKLAFLIGAQVGHTVLTDAGMQMSFDLINPHAVSWVERVGAARVTEIGEETRMAIRSYVEQAFTEGIPARDTARRLITDNLIGLHSRQLDAVENFRLRLEDVGELTDAQIDGRVARYAKAQLRLRANNIARTETMNASSDGQRALWSEAKNQGLLEPDRTRRRWIIADDERLCEDCEAYDGTTATLDGEYTQKRGGTGRYPKSKGPTLHPSCRCAEGLEFSR